MYQCQLMVNYMMIIGSMDSDISIEEVPVLPANLEPNNKNLSNVMILIILGNGASTQINISLNVYKKDDVSVSIWSVHWVDHNIFLWDNSNANK